MAVGRRTRSRRSRRGSTTFESILVLMVLIVASLAAVQFGLALIVKQAVSHAATVAAREAGKGADADELVAVVERVLAGHRIAIGRDAALVLAQGELPLETRGTLACTPPAAPLLDADEVRVTLWVSLTAPPFLNILKPYGIDFTGRTFKTSSVATLE
ncbi:MAG: TadE/TadG family type IV pilus assembly protein [Pirellulaceae bacterium]